MPYEIQLKIDIASELELMFGLEVSSFTVQDLTINNGLLKKGNYYIPVEHILFIKEVV
jgi:hypothetical protein